MPGTVDQWQPVVEIAFEGGPYAEGGLDRAALIELANMQTLLTLYAASLWRSDRAGEHGANDLADEPALPVRFLDQGTLYVNSADPERACATISRRAICPIAGQYIDRAIVEIMQVLQAAEAGSAQPEDVGHRWLVSIKAIGAVVSADVDPDLTLRLTSPCCGSAAITRQTRVAIVRETYRRLDEQLAKQKLANPDFRPLIEAPRSHPEEGLDTHPDSSMQVASFPTLPAVPHCNTTQSSMVQ